MVKTGRYFSFNWKEKFNVNYKLLNVVIHQAMIKNYSKDSWNQMIHIVFYRQ